jgi:hypothetical protein
MTFLRRLLRQLDEEECSACNSLVVEPRITICQHMFCQSWFAVSPFLFDGTRRTLTLIFSSKQHRVRRRDQRGMSSLHLSSRAERHRWSRKKCYPSCYEYEK